MTTITDMTDAEKQTEIIASLGRCLQIVKALFPTMVGLGLKELSGNRDQSTFNRVAQRIEGRLTEKNDDGVQYLDEGDKQLGEHLLHYYRNKFTR